MRAVVVGSGAREHALALALGKSVDVVATPGNPGISGVTPEGYTIASVDVYKRQPDDLCAGPAG